MSAGGGMPGVGGAPGMYGGGFGGYFPPDPSMYYSMMGYGGVGPGSMAPTGPAVGGAPGMARPTGGPGMSAPSMGGGTVMDMFGGGGGYSGMASAPMGSTMSHTATTMPGGVSGAMHPGFNPSYYPRFPPHAAPYYGHGMYNPYMPMPMFDPSGADQYGGYYGAQPTGPAPSAMKPATTGGAPSGPGGSGSGGAVGGGAGPSAGGSAGGWPSQSYGGSQGGWGSSGPRTGFY